MTMEGFVYDSIYDPAAPPPSTPTLMAFTGVTSAHTYYNGIQTQIILGEGKHTDYLTILRGP